MINSSSIYAEKIFAEQPTALWTLDDTFDAPTLITSISGINLKGSMADLYGLSTSNGYYLTDSNSSNTVMVRNSGVPMVYGAKNSTILTPNAGKPSLIVPGYGFLNESGKSTSLTLEFWLRVNNGVPNQEYRVVGPISSTDGIYINGPSLSVKIGNKISSHSVGEWGRPMFLHLSISNNVVTLMVNSETVITIDLDEKDLDFPLRYDETGKSNDYIGFYGYAGIVPIEIDCIAIYSYKVPELVAKRRFAYAEAIPIADVLNTKYFDVPITIDYQFSNYNNNYNYPDTANWESGVSHNISVNEKSLSVPSYKLPDITFEDLSKTVQDWYDAQEAGEDYLVITPAGWNSRGHLSFKSLSVINDSVKGFFGTFIVDDIPATEETLFSLVNNSGYGRIEAVLKPNGTIVYLYNDTEIRTVSAITEGETFVAGLVFDELYILDFFENISNLSLYIGARSDFTKQFSGKLITFALLNSENMEAQSFGSRDNNGIYDVYQTDFDSIGVAYKLFVTNSFGVYGLDIEVAGHWQTYVPLARLASGLDRNLALIQLNVDYPESEKIIPISGSTADYGCIDTANEYVRSYMFVGSIAESIDYAFNPGLSSPVPEHKTTSNSYDLLIGDTSEFVNHTSVSFASTYEENPNLDLSTYAIFIKLYFKVPGILRNSLFVRSLQLAAKANLSDPIGTKYGKNITLKPGTEALLYKESTPFFYLNKYTGVQMSNPSIMAVNSNSEVSFPLNEFASPFYKVSLIQFAVKKKRFLDDEFFMSIDNNPETYIYCNANGELSTDSEDIEFYINGVKSTLEDPPKINKNEWAIVGIKFLKLYNASSTQSEINFYANALIDNVVDYQISPSDEGSRTSYNKWSTIANGIDGLPETEDDSLWSEYNDAVNSNWSDTVLIKISSQIFGTSAEHTYETYTGNNKIVIDYDNTAAQINGYEYPAYLNVIWRTRQYSPA